MKSKMCIDDQGGQFINIENDLSPTLRAQDHGHPPLVFSDKNSAKLNMNPSENVSPTIRGTVIPSVMMEDKNAFNDKR